MSAKITYETPVIADEVSKPMALANQPFLYNSVTSDRRFEELIYSIYKKKIEHDSVFAATYDQIKLMQGVGESGRDCVLYQNGTVNAAIQCKKYANRISKPECVKEIIKFVLFSILDSTLLPDPKNFTYYFVASADFSGPASALLDNWGAEITSEADLQLWTEEVIKKYKSFSAIDYATIKGELSKTLSALTVKRVVPHDLDLELNKPYCSDIITLFFEVKTVFDGRTVEDLLETIEKNKVLLTEEQIVDKFETASLQLSNYKAEFSNLPGSHIERNESKEILDWINSPLPDKQDPVLLLVGDPGYGKSVILKDVYAGLVSSKIPVVGIKSDRYYVSSISELSEKMNLDYSVIDLAKKLLETNKQVVFLIDQIDSLSQAVTTKRDYIDTYNKILHELQRIPGVRVVISIRTFDLNYDYEFSHYRKFKTVTVQPLSKAQLTIVLNRLGININSLSDNFVSLISIPNHLDIFCKIFNPEFNTDQMATLQDLYDELWKQKVANPSDTNAGANRNALFEISEKLHSSQTLLIAIDQLSDKAKDRLAYLSSNGLIDIQSGDVQFFHQSFRDYVFAEHFTENKQSVLHYIQSENQSLYIRPALKMILASLHAKDPKQYIQTITNLLFSRTVRLHLQLLVINQLGFESKPNKAEKEFVVERIVTNTKYRDPFLESAASGGWFETLANASILDSLIITTPTSFETFCNNEKVKKVVHRLGMVDYLSRFNFQKRLEKDCNIWYQIMRRTLVDQPKIALEYLDRIGEFDNKNNIIIRLLTFVKKWDDPLACKLFDKHYKHSTNTWSELDHVLEQAIPYQYNWSLNWFEKTCFDSATEGQYHDPTMIIYHKNAVAKKLFAANREETFVFAISAIRSLIARKTVSYAIDTSVLYTDIVSALYNEDENDYGEFHEKLYKNCMTTAKDLAVAKSAYFDDFIKNASTENSMDIIKIMLFGFEGNPTAYHNEIFTLLQRLYKENAFGHDLKYHLRRLIASSFNSLDPVPQQMLIEMILSIPSENEMFKREIEGKMKFLSWHGHLQFEYLSSISMTSLKAFPAAYKKFCELQRKFKKAENKRKFSFSGGAIGAPLKERAYECMQLDQWENSFLKYDKEHDFHLDDFKGGLTEHYRAFESQVEKRPDFFAAFIDKLITEKKVKVEYMIAGIDGLIKAKYDPKTVFDLYKKLIKLSMSRFDVLRTMWMIDYLSNNRMVDQEIFNYACNVALNDAHPTEVLNPTNPQSDMLNTNRGAATDAVARCWFNPDFAARIFEVLEKIGSDPIVSVRLSAIRHMAYLMNIDKEKTLQLFLSYMKNTTDPHLYKFSIEPAQYLARYNFKAMISYFKTAIEIIDGEEDLKGNIAIILAMAWMNNENEAFSLLEALWKKSDKARAKMIDVAIHNYLSKEPETKYKSEWLFSKFLNDNSTDVIHAFTSVFLHLSSSDFLLYYPLIKKYSVSMAAKIDPHYFYDYLIKCCKQYPVQCIDLLTNSPKYKAPNPFSGPYYDGSEPVKILIGSYNGLYEIMPINSEYINKAMNLFDRMLKKSIFRSAAHQVLNSI